MSLLMAFALSVTLTESLGGVTNTKGAYDSAAQNPGITEVTDKFDLTELREEYINKDLFTVNPYGDDVDRWVIVELGQDSVIDAYKESGSGAEFSEYLNSYLGKNVAADMQVSHRKFLGALDKSGIEYEYKYSYTALTNAVAVKIKNKDINKLSKIKGVTGVHYSESYAQPKVEAVTNNANVYATGIYDTSELAGEPYGYQGQGMVVAILDTGLDFSHPAFSVMPDNDGMWTKSIVETKFAGSVAKKNSPSVTVDQVYYNAKVPYAYDYADDDPDVFPSNSAHGTHVAGIVAGKDTGKAIDESGKTFIGVAPEAQLAIMKVFTDDPESKMLGGADETDILAAVDDCARLGVDVINMSLGSSAGFSLEEDHEYLNKVYSAVEDAGISLVVAASNDYSSGYGGGWGTNLATNPDSATVGAPSTYTAALSVASIEGQKAPYFTANTDANGNGGSVAFINNASDGKTNELDFIKQMYEMAEAKGIAQNDDGSVTFNYVLVGGVGNSINYNSSVKKALSDGKTVALVKRGDITFSEKVQNAMAAGAAAVVIYNNLSGTIRMSVGDITNPVPVCSIGMDEGKLLENAARNNGGTGTMTVSHKYLAGPFMSDFSSWGPTPDLKMKPEITAHGGKIISAVPGGYDEFSGTSMACPNMAGAIAILRQYVKKTTGLSGEPLRSRVNQLLMSTATPALNEEGNEYSPRKQGAGLAGIKDAIDTEVFLTVNDKAGNPTDKPKLELGEDKNKTGEYKMTFTVNNTGAARSFTLKPTVMTETLASDLKTVAEKAYILNDCDISVKVDGSPITDNVVSVPAANGNNLGKAEVEVTVRLGAAGRKYIEDSFKNGMFVEGFIRLIKTNADDINLTIPFMAFYGDWTAAPMFDYSYYEIEESANDSSVKAEDKLKASAGASTPLGLYDDGQYIIQLGTYLYTMSPDDTAIVATDEHAAISIYDEQGNRTLYELTMVYAGLLRGAKELRVEVRDEVTGELVYSDLKTNVRKSLANNGSNVGSPVNIGLNPKAWGLNNNRSYVVTMKGKLDYKDDKGNYVDGNNNEFSFKFAVDTQAPVIKDYRIRFEPYTENKETKYRIFMDVDVYDNQYAAVLLPCYVKDNYLKLITEYPVPIYSQKGGTTTVSFDFTDYYDYALSNDVYFAVEDFAMNQSMFKVDCSRAINYPDKITVATDDKLTYAGTEGTGDNAFEKYYLEIQPNEVYKLNMTSEPDGTAPTKLDMRSSKTRVAQVKKDGNEIFGVAGGEATVTVNANGRKKVQIDVVVKGSAKSAPLPNKVAIEAATDSTGKLVSFNSAAIPAVELNPNETIRLKPSLDPWYVTQLKAGDYQFSSNNESIVTVTSDGVVAGISKGEAFVYVTPTAYPRLRKSIRVYVNDIFDISSFRLMHYYGGKDVRFPEDMNVVYMDEDAFKNNKVIETVVLPEGLTAIPDNAFEGCTNLREITIPSKCTNIGKDAFSGCRNLQRIILLEYEDKVDHKKSDGTITVGLRAFRNCSSLNEIVHAKRITTAHTSSFENCTSLESIDLSGLRVAGSNVFKGCTSLKNVTTDKDTYIGTSMFENCTSLVNFEIKGSRINDGAFKGCEKLANVTFGADSELYYLGDSAFEGTAIASIKLPRTAEGSSCTLGAYAFKDCANLTAVTLSAGTRIDKSKASPFGGCVKLTAFGVDGENANYKVENGLLLSKDGTKLELVPVGLTSVSLPSGVTKIADGAFNGTALTSVELNDVTEIGKYAFAGTKLTSVTLPAGITTVPDGAFYGCSELSAVTFKGSVTAIGNMAFGGAAKLTSIDLTGVETVGASAFVNSGLGGELNVNSITSVGASAFAGTKLTSVNLPALGSIGGYAFGGITALQTATLGGVTNMGGAAYMSGNVIISSTGVFAGCSALESVTFGKGTSVVGAAAFGGLKALTTVNFHADDNGISIGDAAFYSCSLLNEIDFGKISAVGSLSFYGNTALTNPDLSKLKTIGYGAFGGCSKLKTAELNEATEIAENAFAESGLNNVTLSKVEKIGDYAFYGTQLTSVTIPASFNKLLYDDEWEELNDGGHMELITGKKARRLGIGVFSGIGTLKEFKVESGNDVFFTDETGALYSVSEAGYTLEQFPTAKSLDSYTVKTGTVRIADYAFEQAKSVDAVVIPYTVKSIGNAAFFGCSADSYTFEAVEAPALEAAYIDPTTVTDSELRYAFTEENDPSVVPHTSNVFYANFYGYAAEVVEAKYIATKVNFYFAPDFGLTITRPVNGTGYDSVIWDAFFTNTKLSDYAADRVTRAAIAGIDGIKSLSVDAILNGGGSSADKLAAIKAMSKDSVAPVRAQFNLVQDPAQLALVTNSDSLLALEKAIRDARASLGDPVELVELTLTSYPTKVRYVDGETFDPTGMVITAVYADTSRITVTDYTVDVTTITLDTEKVVVSYGGKSIDLFLNVEAKPEGGDGKPDGGCGCGGCGDKTASAMIGLMTLIAAAMSLLILKKH